MDLLELHPQILDYVGGLVAGTPERLITERKRRRLARLDPDDQLRAAEKALAGFLAWRRSSRAA